MIAPKTHFATHYDFVQNRNKGQSRSPDHDAAEAKKNQNWNPNAPLYGKNPAKPAAASGGVTDVTPQPPVAAQKPVADPAKPAKPGADPIGDLAKAKSYPEKEAAALIAARNYQDLDQLVLEHLMGVR